MRPAVDHEVVFVTLTVEDRGDGGIHVTSPDVKGLFLSGKEPERLWTLVPVSVERLLRNNHNMDVVNVMAPPLPSGPRPHDVPVEVELAVKLALAA